MTAAPVCRGRFSMSVATVTPGRLSGPGVTRFLFVVALLAAAGYAAFPFARCEYHSRAGRAAADRLDFSAAHEHFVRALQDRPGRPDLHLLAARCARRAGLYQQADDHLGECQRLRGTDDAISLERAMLVAQRGGLTEDVEAYL